jgi:hypothetical protein
MGVGAMSGGVSARFIDRRRPGARAGTRGRRRSKAGVEPRQTEKNASRKLVVLTVESVVFYSQLDEAAFFWSLKELGRPSHGVGRKLLVTLRMPAPDNLVRGLLGLFRRYAVDTAQFVVFQDPARRPWLTRAVLRAGEKGAR